MTRIRRLLTFVLLIATPPVYAQTSPPQPVSQILPNLFGNTIVLTPTGTPEFPNHSAHFKPGAEQLQTPTRFNEQIVTLLATLPVGSSSGGFTYTFNPTIGSFSRSSESFGPLYMERALTIGKDRGSLGVGYQRSTYDTFERKNLRQPEIKFYIEHTDCCGGTAGGVAVADGTRLNPAFEGDIIEAALTLNLSTDTMVFSGTYGITDRFDLGVAVPLVRVDMSAAVQSPDRAARHGGESGRPPVRRRQSRRAHIRIEWHCHRARRHRHSREIQPAPSRGRRARSGAGRADAHR